MNLFKFTFNAGERYNDYLVTTVSTTVAVSVAAESTITAEESTIGASIARESFAGASEVEADPQDERANVDTTIPIIKIIFFILFFEFMNINST